MPDKLKLCRKCGKEAGYISYVKHVRGPNKSYQGKKCIVCLNCGFTALGKNIEEVIQAWESSDANST